MTTTTLPNLLITTYLEMTSYSQFAPSFTESERVRIERMNGSDVNFYLFMYRAVGEPWHWRDRLLMPRAELSGILANVRTEVYVMYVDGAPAGYVELSRQGRECEIAYFGLREEYMGQGLGKHLLSFGIRQAWRGEDVRRVFVHTCNLDGPHALDNYRKRGFRVYMQHREPMPERYL